MKSIASLSLDLDDKWSYMKTHGDPRWESFPSYLDIAIPRILDFLRTHKLTITFFIVGQDAALQKNHDLLRTIAAAGHEIGNHSFHHEPWLHLYSEQQIEDELVSAEEHIEQATGRRPVGFRGPGFSLSSATLRVLIRRGYLYDATTFPTFLGPLARTYYLMTTKFSAEEKQKRKVLYGSFSEGLRSIKPYRWQTDAGELIEIPVTTMPVMKIPIHVSYVLYVRSFAPALAMLYFRTAMNLCRLTGTQPSLLLHPTDFLDCDDTPELSFFPAMKMPREKKLEAVDQMLHLLGKRFTVFTIQQHAREVALKSSLPVVEPRFRQAFQ